MKASTPLLIICLLATAIEHTNCLFNSTIPLTIVGDSFLSRTKCSTGWFIHTLCNDYRGAYRNHRPLASLIVMIMGVDFDHEKGFQIHRLCWLATGRRVHTKLRNGCVSDDNSAVNDCDGELIILVPESNAVSGSVRGHIVFHIIGYGGHNYIDRVVRAGVCWHGFDRRRPFSHTNGGIQSNNPVECPQLGRRKDGKSVAWYGTASDFLKGHSTVKDCLDRLPVLVLINNNAVVCFVK